MEIYDDKYDDLYAIHFPEEDELSHERSIEDCYAEAQRQAILSYR